MLRAAEDDAVVPAKHGTVENGHSCLVVGI